MIPVRAYTRLLIEYLRPQRGRVAVLVVTLLASIGLQLLNPQLIRVFLDDALAGATTSRLMTLAAWFIGIAIGQQLLAVYATYLAEDVGWTATNRMRGDLATHVLGLDMGFHKQRTPGELIERIDGDVTSLSNFFSAFTIHIVGNALLISGVLVLLWLESPWIGLGITAITAVSFVAMLGFQSYAVKLWKDVRSRSAELFGFIGEQLEGTEDIRANGGDRYMVHRFTEILRDWLPEQVRGRHGFSMLWGLSIVGWALTTALVFAVGAVLFDAGAITLGSVYLVFHYSEMIRHPMEQIRSQMEDFQKAGAGIARVEELFSTVSALDTSGKAELPAGALSLVFDGVSFSYDDAEEDEIVLDGVSFTLRAGRVLGVLGRSGSGKTTLARLLTRLHDPSKGVISLEGIPAPEAAITSIRHRVGMVTQDVQLFRATIRDNLSFYDEDVDDAFLTETLHELDLGSWLEGLPHGLDTVLDSAGGGLSAGQGQLLAFARIFMRDPGIVVLDEASSRLDPATEQLIEHAVDRLLTNRTGLIIAHRLATVNRADDILILEDGRIVEYGTRADLAADPSSRLAHLLTVGMEEVLA